MKKVKTHSILSLILMVLVMNACKCPTGEKAPKSKDEFKYLLEQFGDVKIIRYQIPEFDSLSLQQKELVYYLSEAALCGRDIIYDQNYKYNLLIRKTLEEIVTHFNGDKNTEEYKKFLVYVKRVWFSNGIHHHYSNDKFIPEFSKDYFSQLVKNATNANFPMDAGENTETFINRLIPLIFDPNIAPKKISLDPSTDLIKASATNFYDGVSEKEAEEFYGKMKDKNDLTPISYGLNSRLVKENGKLVEKVFKIGGLYAPAIEKIVFWLNKAVEVAENDQQKKGIQKLIEYYTTGNLKTWDEYNLIWVEDHSKVDFVNGFIEVYGDPLGKKATWESVVNFKNIEATKRTEIISQNAQWFEDHSPVDAKFKKKQVKGVSAKVINVVQLGGDCYPSTPIGINLPNADWIRKEHGSKSVTMENITYAYDQAALGNGFLDEFAYSKEEKELSEKYGFLAGNIHTDLHECLGHGSGQLLPGVSAEAMKNYHSTLEEARADLFALYYIMDPKMVELGILPSLDAAKAEYNGYVRNGLMTQLVRIELDKNIEESHMRNRQLVAKWCYEKGKAENVIEMKVKNNKTYVVINNYEKLRTLFGQLLAEMQRIKSEGDFEAGKKIVEDYAVKVDPVLHKEVKSRYEKLKLTPYGGFINPVLKPVIKDGKITDIKVEYPENYMEQMLYYSKNYSFLPVKN